MDNYFNQLNSINVNDRTENKNGLTYLSWAWAWAEFKKVCPNASYEVVKFDGKPYVYDEHLGYMVYTNVTVDGLTHEMWLPVMDGANKAMRAEAYTYTDRYGKEKTVQAATMFDINKTIMRCLTKNLAMFGLGLYIYAGEDLPDVSTNYPSKAEMIAAIGKKYPEGSKNLTALLDTFRVNSLEQATDTQLQAVYNKVVGSGKANG